MKMFIRLLLTGVLVYFIYGEAGPVTSLAFVLIAIKDEVVVFWIRQAEKRLKILNF